MTNSPQSPYISPLSRTDKLLLALAAIFFIGFSIFLLFPTETVALPLWVVELQGQMRELSLKMTPYLVVGALGAIVAIAELSATFQTYPREALNTRWARILILVNIVSAIVALVLVRITMPETDVVVQVLTVGVGFQAIIRTRFVLAKPIGGGHNGGEISLNLGWLYDQFQNLCRTQIDLELMNNRRTAVTRLIQYYPSLAQLYDTAWYTIIARATLTKAEEEERLAELERLFDRKAPESFARASMALMILENGGQAYVDLLLDQAMNEASQGRTPIADREEQLTRQLMEQFDLDGLVDFCYHLTDNQRIREWVKEAAQPNAGANEPAQKAAVAQFITQQIGVEQVERGLANWQMKDEE
jgi:hypothetical protein